MQPDPRTLAIVAVRNAWLAAIKARDADALTALVTDDVVVVHGNGRCVVGKNAVEADFLAGFANFLVDQEVTFAEITFVGNYVLDIAEVTTSLTPVAGGQAMNVRSQAVTILRSQPDGSWKVARVVGLID